ncbi:hypothetical protein [Pedobacter frigidisoli]|uniref:hypothetical protein n=1 Tax=Pedobacter frigidisoli TaxID=2530455 RepID=UPI00292F3E22|nr:hypothetical protein [Pedobacter frigidisoli]
MEPAELIIITHFGKIYQRSLVTSLLVFLTDESDGIMMFYRNDPTRTPLVGYGAEESLLESILSNDWIWASEDMKYNIKCIEEDSGQSEWKK